MDSTWRKEWKMPEFKSECWMVASGIATKLDVISPEKWSDEACEHKYSNLDATQKLITHELVHIFHGQLNASPDFSDTEEIDWFVEGLATYVSGQCDSIRMNNVVKAIENNKIPTTLNDFWKGDLKYGLSGSIVMFIADKYKKHQLGQLLPFNKKTQILKALNTTEEILLKEWKEYIKNQYVGR